MINSINILPKKLSIEADKEKKLYLVKFDNNIIAEFATLNMAERFMCGQSCAMIIRDALQLAPNA